MNRRRDDLMSLEGVRVADLVQRWLAKFIEADSAGDHGRAVAYLCCVEDLLGAHLGEWGSEYPEVGALLEIINQTGVRDTARAAFGGSASRAEA
jgi:hypothetical protein